MTDIVDQAAEAMRQLPPADRDSMAQAVLSVAQGRQSLDIEPEHMAAVLEGLAQLERGEFIEGEPEELVARAFARGRARAPHAT